MKGFILFSNYNMKDGNKLAMYKDQVAPVLHDFGGRYEALTYHASSLEGSWDPGFVVLVSFPSLTQAQAFYHSEAYASLKQLRQEAIDTHVILFEGL